MLPVIKLLGARQSVSLMNPCTHIAFSFLIIGMFTCCSSEQADLSKLLQSHQFVGSVSRLLDDAKVEVAKQLNPGDLVGDVGEAESVAIAERTTLIGGNPKAGKSSGNWIANRVDDVFAVRR
jgi:hypothetical protein